jgi:AcrR family transcriptional regulator
MSLLADHSFEQVGLAEVAGKAGIKLSQLRAEFGSTLAILAAHIKEIDRVVLAGGDSDMAEEPARERLFDVLMRRLALRGEIPDSPSRSMPWRCARNAGCLRLPASAQRARAEPCGRKARR